MEDLSDWDLLRLADSLSVAEAACCIIGISTTRLGGNDLKRPYIRDLKYADMSSDDYEEENLKGQFHVVLNVLDKSIRTDKLKANKVFYFELENDPYFTETGGRSIAGSINLWETLIDVDDLRRWLEEKHLRPAFFFGEKKDEPDYLDPQNPRYAPKLAAAVRAWQAVIDPGSRSPKQALEKWLREHAVVFGLVDDDGNPINQAVEDCSKVANWNQVGGAPKTPFN